VDSPQWSLVIISARSSLSRDGHVVIRAVQQRRRALLAILVEAGEPSREPLHRSLKLRMEVDEGAQLISQPGESDLIVPPTCLELLDTPIGEVHTFTMLGLRSARKLSSSLFAQPASAGLGSLAGSFLHLCEGGLHQGTLLLQMNGR
jgi:hypothetical protein